NTVVVLSEHFALLEVVVDRALVVRARLLEHVVEQAATTSRGGLEVLYSLGQRRRPRQSPPPVPVCTGLVGPASFLSSPAFASWRGRWSLRCCPLRAHLPCACSLCCQRWHQLPPRRWRSWW